MKTFEQAFRLLPMCLVASFDPARDKTVTDLIHLAQHELDLHNEGEIVLNNFELEQLPIFMRRIA